MVAGGGEKNVRGGVLESDGDIAIIASVEDEEEPAALFPVVLFAEDTDVDGAVVVEKDRSGV